MKVAVCILSVLYSLMTSVHGVPELQLLHVVFAHKTYAPILDIVNSNDTGFPTNLTYEYFNHAAFNMPKTGKLNMNNLGVHLREKYGLFLGDAYTQDIMKMQTADYPMSMMSGQLVNSGLWPPSKLQTWNDDVHWQPVPTEYTLMKSDTRFLGMQCSSFNSEMKKVLRTPEVRQELLHHSPLFDHISHFTEMDIREPSKVALLYSILETKVDLNQSLPNWAEDIFPYGGMYNVTLLQYDLLCRTHLQKQLIGGTMIKEILANSLSYIHGDISKQRKLMIYSGNDRNIVGILKSLDLWSPHIPNEAASVIFELSFDNETKIHGVKINYYTGVGGDTISLKIPNCTETCPIKKFLDLYFDILPEKEEALCNGWNLNPVEEETCGGNTDANKSASHNQNSITIAVLCVVALFVLQSIYTT